MCLFETYDKGIRRTLKNAFGFELVEHKFHQLADPFQMRAVIASTCDRCGERIERDATVAVCRGIVTSIQNIDALYRPNIEHVDSKHDGAYPSPNVREELDRRRDFEAKREQHRRNRK